MIRVSDVLPFLSGLGATAGALPGPAGQHSNTELPAKAESAASLVVQLATATDAIQSALAAAQDLAAVGSPVLGQAQQFLAAAQEAQDSLGQAIPKARTTYGSYQGSTDAWNAVELAEVRGRAILAQGRSLPAQIATAQRQAAAAIGQQRSAADTAAQAAAFAAQASAQQASSALTVSAQAAAAAQASADQRARLDAEQRAREFATGFASEETARRNAELSRQSTLAIELEDRRVRAALEAEERRAAREEAARQFQLTDQRTREEAARQFLLAEQRARAEAEQHARELANTEGSRQSTLALELEERRARAALEAEERRATREESSRQFQLQLESDRERRAEEARQRQIDLEESRDARKTELEASRLAREDERGDRERALQRETSQQQTILQFLPMLPPELAALALAQALGLSVPAAAAAPAPAEGAFAPGPQVDYTFGPEGMFGFDDGLGLSDGPADTPAIVKALQDQARILRSVGQESGARQLELQAKSLMPQPAALPPPPPTATQSTSSWVPWVVGISVTLAGVGGAVALSRWGRDE